MYSPRLCPAITEGVVPLCCCQTRHVATLAVSIAGCVLTVSFSDSAGPFCTSLHRSKPRISLASAYVSATKENSAAGIVLRFARIAGRQCSIAQSQVSASDHYDIGRLNDGIDVPERLGPLDLGYDVRPASLFAKQPARCQNPSAAYTRRAPPECLQEKHPDAPR